MGQTARTLWGAMRMPLWSFPVSYGHAFMFFSLYSGFTSYSIFTLYAMSHCMVGWCLMSPRYVERRVVVLAGYHVITISLGEVNKRFCQSTAVMQSVEGDCTDLFFFTRTCTLVGIRAETSALGGVLDLLDGTWIVTPAHVFNCFTMCFKDAAPVCECCRKQVEVRAHVRFLFWCLAWCAWPACHSSLCPGHFWTRSSRWWHMDACF